MNHFKLSVIWAAGDSVGTAIRSSGLLHSRTHPLLVAPQEEGACSTHSHICRTGSCRAAVKRGRIPGVAKMTSSASWRHCGRNWVRGNGAFAVRSQNGRGLPLLQHHPPCPRAFVRVPDFSIRGSLPNGKGLPLQQLPPPCPRASVRAPYSSNQPRRGWDYFFRASRISARRTSERVGSGGAVGAGAGSRLILLTTFTSRKTQAAMMRNSITVFMKMP